MEKGKKRKFLFQPPERFELSTPGLQDQCSNPWATEADIGIGGKIYIIIPFKLLPLLSAGEIFVSLGSTLLMKTIYFLKKKYASKVH